VRTAAALWLGAIGAFVAANLLGMVVVAVVLDGPPAAYSLIAAVVLAVLGLGLLLVARMRGGADWARTVLAVAGVLDVLLGGYGLLAGVGPPGTAPVVVVLNAVLTVVELLLVAAAIVFMYRPGAAGWFR
jgi:hypothetical protein